MIDATIANRSLVEARKHPLLEGINFKLSTIIPSRSRFCQVHSSTKSKNLQVYGQTPIMAKRAGLLKPPKRCECGNYIKITKCFCSTGNRFFCGIKHEKSAKITHFSPFSCLQSGIYRLDNKYRRYYQHSQAELNNM